MKKDMSAVTCARLASGMTIEDARSVVGLTYPPYKSREEDPSLFTVGELSRLTHSLNAEGRAIIKKWAISFFGL